MEMDELPADDSLVMYKKQKEEKSKKLFRSIEQLSVFVQPTQDGNRYFIIGKNLYDRNQLTAKSVLSGWPAIELTPENIEKIFQGKKIRAETLTPNDILKSLTLNIGLADSVQEIIQQEFRNK